MTDGPANPPIAQTDIAPAKPPHDPRIALLERQVEELSGQLQEANLRAEMREAEAHARGKQEGAERADSEARKRTESLTEALHEAQLSLSAQLDRLEVLSLEVAQTALARIFGDESCYTEMVAQCVRHQLRQMNDALVVRVRVSDKDFSDSQAMGELASQFPDLALQTDTALKQGQCTIDLKSGRIDAGITDQWSQLSQLLDTMAAGDAEP